MKYLCLLFTLLCLSCSSVRRTVRTVDKLSDSGRMVVHDTVRMVRYFRDSVFVRDSVYLSGGVMVKERWRDRWRVRLDTVYRVRRDTVERVRVVERMSSDDRRVGGVLGGDVPGDEGAAADEIVAAGLGVPGVGFGVVGESGLVQEVGAGVGGVVGAG